MSGKMYACGVGFPQFRSEGVYLLSLGRLLNHREAGLLGGQLIRKEVMPGIESTVIALYERFASNSRALAAVFDRQGRADGRTAKSGRPIKTT